MKQVPYPVPANIYVDGLLYGDAKTIITLDVNPITYSFYNDGSDPKKTWENYQIAAMELALASWSNVANVKFAQVANNTEATFKLRIVKGSEEWQVPIPVADFAGPGGNGFGRFNNEDGTWNFDGLQQGAYYFNVFVHEIGHGLGLKHPFDQIGTGTFPGVINPADLGSDGLNHKVWTVMSYNAPWGDNTYDSPELNNYGWPGSPMTLDIAAIQHLYGANMTYKTGDDLYELPNANQLGTFYSALWDAGGIDTISAASAGTGATIDLRAAELTGKQAGGFASRVNGIYGGFTIASGVVIENGIGGTGNDMITGNAANNALQGAGGNDTLIGQAGDDSLDGGAGDDSLDGGAGDDSYIVDSSGDTITEAANGGKDSVFSSIDYTLPNDVEKLTLTGNNAMAGTGNSLNNNIIGNAGNNTLEGGAGNDALRGNLGNDTLRGDLGGDIFEFKSTADGVDTIEDFSLQEGDQIRFYSPAQADQFTYNAETGAVSFNNQVFVILANKPTDFSPASAIDWSDAPTGIALSTSSVAENVPIGTVIGSFSSTDPDSIDSFTYSLVSGTGDTDNAAFTIDSNQLKLAISPNFESQSLYRIRINTTDEAGLSYAAALTISITDVNEDPTATDETLGTPLPPIQFKRGKKGMQRSGTNRDDTLRGSGGNDRVLGRRGNDLLVSGAGNDWLDGGSGNDRHKAGKGNDWLLGGKGNDRLLGNVGDDVIIGGAGADVSQGGAGRDTFVFNAVSEGTDVIEDFEATADLIDLRSIFAQAAFSGATPFGRFTQFVQLEQVGSDTAVKIDADGNGTEITFVTLATLKNVSLSAVSGLNFVIT